MELKKKLDGFFQIIAKVVQKFAAVLMLLMIVVVSIQVLGRVFQFKLPWTEEIATYSLIWMTYIGSIAVLIKAEHLTVDILLVRYQPQQRRFVRVLIDAVLVTFCGILLVFGVQLCINPIIINGSTPALAVSRVWIYLSLPIAMFFNVLYAFYDFIIACIEFFKGGIVCSGQGEAPK